MKTRRISIGIVAGCLAVALTFAASPRQAHARPKYKDVFGKTYPGLATALNKVKCAACHPTNNNRKKQKRNDYGMALGKALGKTNVKEADAIEKAMKTAEGQKSSTAGKTFGDLIKAGMLPGKNE